MASAWKIRRRMSVDESTSDLLSHVHKTIRQLSALWDQVSMDQVTREKRTESAYTLFNNTLSEIVASEQEMVKGVFEGIKRISEDVDSVRQELGLPAFPTHNYVSNSIALLKALGEDMTSLAERKQQALAHQLEEYNQLIKLCRCLGESPPEVESIQEKIMSKTQIEGIIKKGLHSHKELKSRKKKVREFQNKINRRVRIVKDVILSDDEKAFLSVNLDDPGMIFSIEVIDGFDKLLKKLETEYEKWRENIAFQYLACHSRLLDLSKKCYAPDLLERYPEKIDFDVHDEPILHNIRSDLDMLQKRYDSGKQVFDKFSQWYAVFEKQEEIETEMSSDEARKNRGGYLNKLLTGQKKADACADRYLKELQAECNEKTDVMINDLNPYQFALNLVQNRMDKKEREKEVKKVEKARNLEHESVFGTSTRGGPSIKKFGASRIGIGHPKSPSRSVMKTPSKSVITKTPSRAEFRGCPSSIKKFGAGSHCVIVCYPETPPKSIMKTSSKAKLH